MIFKNKTNGFITPNVKQFVGDSKWVPGLNLKKCLLCRIIEEFMSAIAKLNLYRINYGNDAKFMRLKCAVGMKENLIRLSAVIIKIKNFGLPVDFTNKSIIIELSLFNLWILSKLTRGLKMQIMSYAFTLLTLGNLITPPLHRAAKTSNVKAVQRLLWLGADVNQQDQHAFTALHFATMCANPETVQALIAGRANLNLQDSHGLTPLHWALMSSRKEIAQILFKAGANTHLPDRDGDTVLHLAAEPMSVPLLQALIASGANVNQQNNQGKTPLHYLATCSCDQAIAKILLDAGADITLVDAKGQTPLDIAEMRGNHDFILYVEKYVWLMRMSTFVSARHSRLGSLNPTLRDLPVWIYRDIFEWLKKSNSYQCAYTSPQIMCFNPPPY